MTIPRSDIRTASSIACVTKMTVVRACSQICRSSSCMRWRLMASSAPNGSAPSKTRGRAAGAPGRPAPRLHAARELARVVVAEAGEADELEVLHGPRLALGLGQPGELERHQDVLDDRAPRQQSRRLEHRRAVGPGALDRAA